MRTPSLRNRVVVLGVIVVVIVVASINGVLYLAFQLRWFTTWTPCSGSAAKWYSLRQAAAQGRSWLPA